MRENKNIALQMSCGDISEVEINGNEFIATTEEEYLYNIINTDYGVKEVDRAIKWFGYSYKFKIEKRDKPIDKAKVDIEKLKSIFGDYLKIK